MDNSQKAIMIGVGLFLTILIISIVLLVANIGISTTREAKEQGVKINSNLERQLITLYDKKIVTSDDVLYAFNVFSKTLNQNIGIIEYQPHNIHIVIYCKTGILIDRKPNNITYEYYQQTDQINTDTFITMQPTTEIKNKIRYNKKYNSYLIKNNNLEIIGIIFEETS